MILPLFAQLADTQLLIEQEVMEALRDIPSPSACPPNHLFVPEDLCLQVLFFATHPGNIVTLEWLEPCFYLNNVFSGHSCFKMSISLLLLARSVPGLRSPVTPLLVSYALCQCLTDLVSCVT